MLVKTLDKSQCLGLDSNSLSQELSISQTTKAIISKGLITNTQLDLICLQILIGCVRNAYFVLLAFICHIPNHSQLGDKNRFY